MLYVMRARLKFACLATGMALVAFPAAAVADDEVLTPDVPTEIAPIPDTPADPSVSTDPTTGDGTETGDTTSAGDSTGDSGGSSDSGSGGDSTEEPPPTGTPEPEGGPESTLPPIPEECDQGNGRYVCPDGLPPYGCWAVPVPDGREGTVGLCIDPPEPPINLCEWEPMSCPIPVDPPVDPSCEVDPEGSKVCYMTMGGPRPTERGGVKNKSGHPKPKGKGKKKTTKKSGATKRSKPTPKPKATKKPASTKKSGKKKPKASKR